MNSDKQRQYFPECNSCRVIRLISHLGLKLAWKCEKISPYISQFIQRRGSVSKVTVNFGWVEAQPFCCKETHETSKEKTVKTTDLGGENRRLDPQNKTPTCQLLNLKLGRQRTARRQQPLHASIVRSFGAKNYTQWQAYAIDTGHPWIVLNSRGWVYMVQFTLKIWRLTIN